MIQEKRNAARTKPMNLPTTNKGISMDKMDLAILLCRAMEREDVQVGFPMVNRGFVKETASDLIFDMVEAGRRGFSDEFVVIERYRPEGIYLAACIVGASEDEQITHCTGNSVFQLLRGSEPPLLAEHVRFLDSNNLLIDLAASHDCTELVADVGV
ncbi:hypothetical protein BIZ37_07980 [Photobacterium sp. BZF1]|uniref:hypothetical protein n=1 Tax=Photobacterium sp. BZF1 TaxID=1904457 RepID=UPI0016536DAA|nr:hypothetical protein [Photobacterium sp. BZF1]MBC7002495.1 hypothetical protein [Photobacterium sp. BZF1]